ncbi:Defective in cullin neddylation protein [Mycena indigotica]|uniref:Defective in cullin neddylation protein n=1 Tax=Mycena indigotica TaxID=2126181 RepID=A0A8H6S9K8_9AGAR|nr:Defective in cullin neddylation protein [Mycena indigotica]KAF7294705.1 Defective in cullin neddylation protein [Mycena indigotica]
MLGLPMRPPVKTRRHHPRRRQPARRRPTMPPKRLPHPKRPKLLPKSRLLRKARKQWTIRAHINHIFPLTLLIFIILHASSSRPFYHAALFTFRKYFRDDNSDAELKLDDDTQTSAPPPTKAAATKSTPGKVEPYSAERAASIFTKYADEDDPNVIGPEGLERFCTDAEIPLEGALPLIIAWQLDAKEMGKFTKEEWTKGTDSIRISSLPQLAMFASDLEQLLTKGKAPAKSGNKKDPYDRSAISRYTADPKAAFQTFYSYCFSYAKPEQSRNIDMETSVALWGVLLTPQYPIMSEVLEFIGEKDGAYKATNKDLWSMMLEFCRTIKPSLQDYEADGAWPTLLDDFVAWKKEKMGNGAVN